MAEVSPTTRTLWIFTTRKAAREAGFTRASSQHEENEAWFSTAVDEQESFSGLQFEAVVVAADVRSWVGGFDGRERALSRIEKKARDALRLGTRQWIEMAPA